MTARHIDFVLRLCLLLALPSLLAACQTQIEERIAQEYQPTYPIPLPPASDLAPTGGIYTAQTGGFFVNDRRAARVGDILTVRFNERISASKSQSTSGSRSSSYEVDLPTLLAAQSDDAGFASESGQSFAGKGAAQQSNSLSGLVSVSVMRVLPGGQLEIMGQKRLTLNNGREYVRLTGVVRPEDIDADNIVQSDRIAHADIQYVGAGDVADTSQRGWFSRVLTSVSPL